MQGRAGYKWLLGEYLHSRAGYCYMKNDFRCFSKIFYSLFHWTSLYSS